MNSLVITSLITEVGGVRTNFQMPDVLSIGLGGGSIVSTGSKVTTPLSVSHLLPISSVTGESGCWP